MNHHNHRESSYLRAYKAIYLRAYKALHLSRALYKSALFMQNKPNLMDALMNVKSIHTVDYENKSNWTLGENKPNTNPIRTQSNPISPARYAIRNTRYEIQTQSNPIRVQDFAVRPCEILFFARIYLPNPVFIFSTRTLHFGIFL